ncbi:serine/threonine-protein kinase grp [Copidosoma floridanum]|uniref:serine/threonine-protein kinase grp n=1 Tax=Copidosoma floridanum TaxID=29053 RepID=UPI0006C94FC0|nr:serine/threonine-protein kinase grp [Copidosoma floridanum]
MKMTEFVDGWILGEVLGEGAYGEVRLVINKVNGEAVAMKMVDLNKHPDARCNVRKETTIHRMLSNPNIIQYFGQRSELNVEYIFLEYASGGELFDRIEPDVGMPLVEARKYFRQLIMAVEYLHKRGVAHRDLKPENLLLDAHNNLKVSDFGLATVYRFQGKERRLDKKCGTLPYVAPEVLEVPYNAEPADIWSCGIILTALLAGELPWDQACMSCLEYVAWKDYKYEQLTPWKKLDEQSLSLIRKILNHIPSSRYTLFDIKGHIWYNIRFSEDVVSELCVESDKKNHNKKEETFSFSQPELPPVGNSKSVNIIELRKRTGLSFSQPTIVDNLLICSQLQTIQTQTSQNTLQNLVRRMTRFFVPSTCEKTVTIITEALERNNYHFRVNNFGIVESKHFYATEPVHQNICQQNLLYAV